jgi:hypothetical protein
VYDAANRPIISVANWDGTPIESEADCAFPPTQADANLCTVTYYDTHGRRAATAQDRVGFVTSQVLTFTIDNTSPTVQTTAISEDSPYAHVSGSTVYYGDGSGSFIVEVEATDATAGLDEIVFPATTSNGTSYDYDGETSATPSHVYTFNASDSFDGDATVTAEDRAGNQGSTTFTVTRDVDAPVVTVQALANGATVNVNWGGTTDAGSGVSHYDVDVKVDDEPWTPWLVETTDTSDTYDGEPGHTYTFRVTATDNVGNEGRDEAEARVAAVTKYYYFGGRRVAMRSPDGVYYLHTDHPFGGLCVAS